MAKSKPKRQRAKSSRGLVVAGLVLAAGAGATWWLSSRSAPGSASNTPTNAAAPVSNSIPPRADTASLTLEQWLAGSTNAAEIFNTGNQMLAESRLDEAIACYQRAIALRPEDEEAHFALGVALARAGRDAEAEQSYRAALKVYPEYPEAHMNLGNLLLRQKRVAEGISALEEARKAAPEDPLIHNNLGRALAMTGKLDAAIERFLEAAQLDTNYVEARFNLGASYLTKGDTNKAVEAFQDALKLDPSFAPANQMLERLKSAGSR